MWDMYNNQNGICNLSGLSIRFLENASIDRIDSSGHYTENNVQWVDKKINGIKMALSEDEFIKLCGHVYEHRIKQFDR
jgi:hypothetical protein